MFLLVCCPACAALPQQLTAWQSGQSCCSAAGRPEWVCAHKAAQGHQRPLQQRCVSPRMDDTSLYCLTITILSAESDCSRSGSEQTGGG